MAKPRANVGENHTGVNTRRHDSLGAITVTLFYRHPSNYLPQLRLGSEMTLRS